MAADQTVEDAFRLVKRLDESLGSKDYEALKDLLAAAKELPMTLPVLTKTRIGLAVAKVAKAEHEAVAKAAKEVVAAWKKVAEANGVPSSTSASSSSGAGVHAGAGAAVKSPSAAAAPAPPPSKSLPPLPPSRDKCRSIFVRGLMKVAAAKGIVRDAPAAAEAKPAAAAAAAPEEEAEGGAGKLTFSAAALQGIADSVGHRLEAALFEKFGGVVEDKPQPAYGEQFKVLAFGLPRNEELSLQLLFSYVEPEEVAVMSAEDISSTEAKRKREAIQSEHEQARMTDWSSRPENRQKMRELLGLGEGGLLHCPKCKSKNTDYYEKQTRSADEPMTVFGTCFACKHKWRQ